MGAGRDQHGSEKSSHGVICMNERRAEKGYSQNTEGCGMSAAFFVPD
jgi:hypothetical protein